MSSTAAATASAALLTAGPLDITNKEYTILGMWHIRESRAADKVLSSGRVPLEVLKRYEKWKDIAALSGPQGLRAIRGFRDEALAGEWRGSRSSRLDGQWRVIYRVEADILTVLVVRVSAHDYRRK